jgi:TonB family protein
MSSPTIFRRLAILIATVLVVTSVVLGQDESTRKIKVKVDPVYPPIAKTLHLSGTVKIQVTIAPNGTIKSTKVVGGHPVLVEPALDAVKRWKFEPGDQETTEIISIKFMQ